MLKLCGHRLDDKHFLKIKSRAVKWKIGEAEALRRIIDEA